RRKSVTLAGLASQPLVLREQGSTTRRALERALARRGLKANPVFEIGSREGVWKAVEQGLGVSVVADFEFVAHPNLRALEISDAEIRTEYRIVCLRDRVASPKIAAFMKVAETLRQPYQGSHTKFPEQPDVSPRARARKSPTGVRS